MKKKSFAIIGNPISHSLSPILHNYWFDKYKINASYSSLNTDEKDLENVIKSIRNKELSGINITCLLYTSPSPRDGLLSRMPSSA